MTALTADKPLVVASGPFADLPVKTGVNIFQGSLVGLESTGYARPFQLGDRFRGHTPRGMDNTDGNSGDVHVQTYRGRYRLQVVLANVAITHAKKSVPVYALDSGTLSLREGLLVGRVIQYVSSGIALVEFDTELETEVISQTVKIADFTDNANTTGFVDLTVPVPEGSLVKAVQFDVIAGFSGDTSATAQAGISGTLDRFSAAIPSVLAIDTVGTVANTTSAKQPYVASSTTVRVTVTGAADFTSISAGEMDVRIVYERLLPV